MEEVCARVSPQSPRQLLFSRNIALIILDRLFPTRAGSGHVDHALTTFTHVLLPSMAILGDLGMPKDLHLNFATVIHVRQSFYMYSQVIVIQKTQRVAVGVLAVSTLCIAALQASVYVAGMYSLRRMVTDPSGGKIPIIEFRTQQLPILHTLAQIQVMEAYASSASKQFMDLSLIHTVRHGIVTAFKAVLVSQTQTNLYELAERCGAQGLYMHNQIIQSQLEMRGISIAEGDILVLSIRTFL